MGGKALSGRSKGAERGAQSESNPQDPQRSVKEVPLRPKSSGEDPKKGPPAIKGGVDARGSLKKKLGDRKKKIMGGPPQRKDWKRGR